MNYFWMLIGRLMLEHGCGYQVNIRICVSVRVLFMKKIYFLISGSSFFQQIFHCYCPVRFGRKADPNGDYIRKYLPCLKVIQRFDHSDVVNEIRFVDFPITIHSRAMECTRRRTTCIEVYSGTGLSITNSESCPCKSHKHGSNETSLSTIIEIPEHE